MGWPTVKCSVSTEAQEQAKSCSSQGGWFSAEGGRAVPLGPEGLSAAPPGPAEAPQSVPICHCHFGHRGLRITCPQQWSSWHGCPGSCRASAGSGTHSEVAAVGSQGEWAGEAEQMRNMLPPNPEAHSASCLFGLCGGPDATASPQKGYLYTAHTTGPPEISLR